MKKTKIILGKDGSIKAEGFGYTGGECIKKVEFLEKLFGSVDKRELKPEFYEEKETNTLLDTNGLPSGWCG